MISTRRSLRRLAILEFPLSTFFRLAARNYVHIGQFREQRPLHVLSTQHIILLGQDGLLGIIARDQDLFVRARDPP